MLITDRDELLAVERAFSSRMLLRMYQEHSPLAVETHLKRVRDTAEARSHIQSELLVYR